MDTRPRYDDAAAVSRRGDAGDATESTVEEPFDSAHGPEPVEGPQRRKRPGVVVTRRDGALLAACCPDSSGSSPMLQPASPPPHSLPAAKMPAVAAMRPFCQGLLASHGQEWFGQRTDWLSEGEVRFPVRRGESGSSGRPRRGIRRRGRRRNLRGRGRPAETTWSSGEGRIGWRGFPRIRRRSPRSRRAGG